MGRRSWLGQYAVAAVVFTAVDLVWLGAVANDLYRDVLGDLLADRPNPLAAVVFYAIFVAGLVHFVVRPSLAREPGPSAVRSAAGNGAFFGLVTYATWDLTNLAVLEGFPWQVVPVDLAWGAVLATTVCTVTHLVWRRWEGRSTGVRGSAPRG